jgi:Helicase HerA, central domain
MIELIHRILREDARIIPRSRYGILLGVDHTGAEVYLEPNRGMLIAGNSGSGKSMFATLLTERMVEKQFEFCVIDAEGDYHGLAHAVCVGDGSMPPAAEDALTLLQKTGVNLVINTLDVQSPW